MDHGVSTPDQQAEQQESWSWLETPFTIRHVESHLIFGPVARGIPLGPILVGLGLLGAVLGQAIPNRGDDVASAGQLASSSGCCWSARDLG